MYKKTQTAEGKEKARFRTSAKWKKFRAFLKKECNGLDFITGKKLLKGFQVHHKDMRLENYKNISDPKRFLACNKRTHEFIHFAFTYYDKDPDFLTRLKDVLDDMKQFNSD